MSYRFAGPRLAGAYTFDAAAADAAAGASYRHGAPMLAGAFHFGGGGLGVLGSRIPATGTNGPSFLFNDLSLPADATTEVRGLVVTPPNGLSQFFVDEDGSFSAAGPDGSYSFTYRLFADGVDSGTAVVNLQIG